jgi:hypothetical protein
MLTIAPLLAAVTNGLIEKEPNVNIMTRLPRLPPPQPVGWTFFKHLALWIRSRRSGRSRYAVIGIVMPLACLYFDPALFQGGLVPLSPSHVAFCYALIGTSMAAFSFRLAFQRGGAFIAGAIAAGGVFAGLLGLILLSITALFVIGVPSMSLAGLLMVCLGLLGATPLFVSRAYFRTANDAWCEGENSVDYGYDVSFWDS